MPHFERQRIAVEITEDFFQLLNALGSVLEAPRILDENGAQAFGFHQRIEILAKVLHVIGTALRRFVCKTTIYFRTEFKVGIALYTAYPALRVCEGRDAVERRVDFDRVEERREIGQRIESRAVRWVDSPLPIGVTPAGGTDADSACVRGRQLIDILILSKAHFIALTGHLC